MNLIWQTNEIPHDCKECEKIKTKRSRQQNERARIARWAKEPHKHKADIQKAIDIVRELEDDINKLWIEKQKNLASMGSQSGLFSQNYWKTDSQNPDVHQTVSGPAYNHQSRMPSFQEFYGRDNIAIENHQPQEMYQPPKRPKKTRQGEDGCGEKGTVQG